MSHSLYYLIPLLPTLSFEGVAEKKTPTFNQLKDEVFSHLPSKHLQDLRFLLTWFDLENLRRIWSGTQISPYGNFESNDQLLSALDAGTLYSKKISQFLGYYILNNTNLEERIAHFPEILISFLEEASSYPNEFIRNYFLFKKELRLLFLGARAHHNKIDLMPQIESEDHFDPIVANLISQKDSPHFTPLSQDDNLCAIIDQMHHLSATELMKKVYFYKFNKISQLNTSTLFSVDQVFCVLMQLIVLEEYQKYDVNQGLNIMNTILKESYE